MQYRTERADFWDADGPKVLIQVIDHLTRSGVPFDSRVYVEHLDRVLLQRKTWTEAGDGVLWVRLGVSVAPKLTLLKRAVR